MIIPHVYRLYQRINLFCSLISWDPSSYLFGLPACRPAGRDDARRGLVFTTQTPPALEITTVQQPPNNRLTTVQPLPTNRPITIPVPTHRWLLLFLALWMAALLVLCGFYLSHSRAALQDWFVSLQPCFYRPDHWAAHFFTPETKSTGNAYCAVAIPLCMLMMFLAVRGLRQRGSWWRMLFVARRHILPALTILVAGTALWIWAHTHIRPYMDEVFSAVHIGELHPFQGLAYYMLPNNHLLFTVLNNVFFHYNSDLVFTGRIISGVAYLASLLLLYRWMYGCMKSSGLALATVLLLALFFPAWGFAGQARGYSLLLLAGWGSFVYFLGYSNSGSRIDLRWHTLAVVGGYAVMPTFLYLHPALLICAGIVQWKQRRVDFRFWKYMAVAATMVFLFYLPALSFSGTAAFTANEYVRPADMNQSQFVEAMGEMSRRWMQYFYTGHVDALAAWWAFLPLLMPLSLLVRSRYRMHGIFFLLLWISLCGFLLLMHRFPPVRALIFHLHFTFAVTLLSLFLFLNNAAHRLKRPAMRWIWFPLLLPLYWHYGQTGRGELAATLYHFDINEYGRLLQLNLRDLPPGASAGCSDESFYLYYIGQQRGFRMVKCSNGEEQYYIKLEDEALPPLRNGHWEKRWDRGDWRIYERKQ